MFWKKLEAKGEREKNCEKYQEVGGDLPQKQIELGEEIEAENKEAKEWARRLKHSRILLKFLQIATIVITLYVLGNESQRKRMWAHIQSSLDSDWRSKQELKAEIKRFGDSTLRQFLIALYAASFCVGVVNGSMLSIFATWKGQSWSTIRALDWPLAQNHLCHAANLAFSAASALILFSDAFMARRHARKLVYVAELLSPSPASQAPSLY